MMYIWFSLDQGVVCLHWIQVNTSCGNFVSLFNLHSCLLCFVELYQVLSFRCSKQFCIVSPSYDFIEKVPLRKKEILLESTNKSSQC